jgi:hypothetical protein
LYKPGKAASVTELLTVMVNDDTGFSLIKRLPYFIEVVADA